MIGRMADETPALISQGVTLVTGFDLGWLFQVARSERFSASGSLGVKNTTTTDVYLQRFVEGIIEMERSSRATGWSSQRPRCAAPRGSTGHTSSVI